MKNVPFIEDIKLRVGRGKSGNQEIPNYLYSTTSASVLNDPFGNTINQGTTFLTSGTVNFHWEQKATNFGLDFSCFGNKIEFICDYFQKKTENMLIQPTIPYMAGLRITPYINSGSIENTGIELTLRYKEKIDGFHSNIGINFSSYNNKVINFGERSVPIMDAGFMNQGFVTLTKGL
jgi:hypothetical protein